MTSIYEAIPKPFKSWAFRGYFSMAIPGDSDIRAPVILRHDSQCQSHEVVFEREGGRLAIGLDYLALLSDQRRVNSFWKRLPIMVSLFAATDRAVRGAAADISDGRFVGERRMCFCSNRWDALLVPDRHFVKSDGYRRYRSIAVTRRHNWSTRRNVVLWRGNLSGGGIWPTAPTDVSRTEVNHRARMCLLLRDNPGVDAKLSRSGKLFRNREQRDFSALGTLGIYGDFVPQQNWIGVKFALDIDGNTNAWVNLFVRLILGCCVIKIESQRGFRQWYYDELVPWRHFVPVRSDMSDLIEKIEWCRAHDAECAKIAAAGQAFAFGRTVKSERALTIARLNEALAE